MNGINNNISNSNYGSLGNNGSNNPKEEKSIFDDIVDSVKEFFDGDSENDQFASYDAKINSTNANIDRAYFNSRMNMQNSYTLAPEKNSETLAERWAKDNESAELKQKENQIMKLKQKVDVLENRNNVLSKQNEYMVDKMPAQHQNQATTRENTVVQKTDSTEVVDSSVQNDRVKTYDSIPTHTSIPNDAFEKQQNEIEEFSQSLKAEAPKEVEKKEDKQNSVEAKA